MPEVQRVVAYTDKEQRKVVMEEQTPWWLDTSC